MLLDTHVFALWSLSQRKPATGLVLRPRPCRG
uniref:Uncharacterized protein n=1 Tax=Rhizophora mucronata TaxID=61149 RepID=A0A2P2P5K0_RHIMU